MALALAIGLVAAPAVPASANTVPPPPPTTVQLSTSSTAIQIPDGTASLTAVTDAELAGTGYAVAIVEGWTAADGSWVAGTRVAFCTSGTSCSATSRTGWSENTAAGTPRPKVYRAQLGRYSFSFAGEYFDVVAQAGPVTVTPVPVRSVGVALAASAPTIQIPDGRASVTATSARDLAGTGYSIAIFQGGSVQDGIHSGGSRLAICTEAQTCSVTVSTGWSENSATAQPATRTYWAKIGRYRFSFAGESFDDILGQAGPVDVTPVPVRSIAAAVSTSAASIQIPDGRATVRARPRATWREPGTRSASSRAAPSPTASTRAAAASRSAPR